uniref:Uncharacterized protein n=1 Tax=Meloidogyne enterolobii TaxID=390850 RepID=A0A6V7UIB3_MELEN|nr:unnamed protein product [Meloidogyne enterolobii]
MSEKQQQSNSTKNISNISRRRKSPQIQSSTSSSQIEQQQSTPSPPLNEQSPQLLIGNNNNNADQQQRSQLHLSGMRTASSLAEWQLQAVLYRARLTQYFDVFISQGGDDIDQIMQCDETEFLEIMSLVGMASKPLHVRRLQRTLSEFSVNRAQFLITTVPFIGLPPIDFPSTSSSTDNLTAALQFLVPGYLPSTGQLDLAATLTQQQLNNQQTPFIDPDFLFPLNPTPPLSCPVTTSFQQNSATTSSFPPSFSLSQHILLSLVNPTTTSSILNQQPLFFDNFNKRARMSFSPPPNTPPSSGGVLIIKEAKEEPEQINCNEEENTTIIQNQIFPPPSYSSCSSPSSNERLNETELHRLSQLANELINLLPPKLEPKKRLERSLLEALALPQDDPLRVEHFRLFSRFYGRFDAKRRSDRTLTRHESVVNEAAAQLCLLRPDLLTRRDQLFPLARKLARMFETPTGNNFSSFLTSCTNNSKCSSASPEHSSTEFSGEEEKYKREQVEEDEEEEELKEEEEEVKKIEKKKGIGKM